MTIPKNSMDKSYFYRRIDQVLEDSEKARGEKSRQLPLHEAVLAILRGWLVRSSS